MAWARVQWAVTLGLVPLLLALFQQVSLVSPLANALAIPLVSLAVVPLALLGVRAAVRFRCCMLAHAVMALVHGAARMDEPRCRRRCGSSMRRRLDGARRAARARSGCCCRAAFPARWLGVLALLPLFLCCRQHCRRRARLRLTVLDVGQGLAVVAQTRNHALLYDAGPAFGRGADSGNRIIVPYLRAGGVRAARRHDRQPRRHRPQRRRRLGARGAAGRAPVHRRCLTCDPLPSRRRAGFPVLCRAAWDWDGVRFEMLHPARRKLRRSERIRDNDRSCVLRITAGGRRGAADRATSSAERKSELMPASRDELRADVLMVPHHGSRTSSTPEFVAAVAPRGAIFPVGYRNRFGHPQEDAAARYRGLGSRIYRTDLDGALTVRFETGGAISIEPYRAVYRRYWQTIMVDDPVAAIEGF